MSLTEEKRINLANSAREVLGVENGNTLMEHLPPVGWADVATKEDVSNSTIATQHDIAVLAAQTKSDIAALAAQTKSDIAATKHDIAALAAETKSDFAALQAETKHQFMLVGKEIGQLEFQILARLEIQSQILTAQMYKAINRSTLIYVVSLLTAMFINRI